MQEGDPVTFNKRFDDLTAKWECIDVRKDEGRGELKLMGGDRGGRSACSG